IPVFVLMAVFGWYGDRVDENVKNPTLYPQTNNTVTRTIKGSTGAPANVLNVVGPSTFSIGGKPDFKVNVPSRLAASTAGSTGTLTVGDNPLSAAPGRSIPAGEPIKSDTPIRVTVPENMTADAPMAKLVFNNPADVTFELGSNVPNA